MFFGRNTSRTVARKSSVGGIYVNRGFTFKDLRLCHHFPFIFDQQQSLLLAILDKVGQCINDKWNDSMIGKLAKQKTSTIRSNSTDFQSRCPPNIEGLFAPASVQETEFQFCNKILGIGIKSEKFLHPLLTQTSERIPCTTRFTRICQIATWFWRHKPEFMWVSIRHSD